MSQWQRSPTLGQVLDRLKETAKRQIRVAIPGQVQAYDAATQTADVQPLIDDQVQQEDGSYAAMPFPVIAHAPVAFFGGGGFRLTFPVQPGDTGILLVCDLSLDAWKQQGGRQSPLEQRRHHLADAVFLPGLHADSAPWTGASLNAVTLGKDSGPQVVLRANSVELGGSDLTPPVDGAVKGTTYRAAEDVLFTGLETALSAAGGALVSMSTDAAFSAAFAPAAAFAGTAGAALNAFAAALAAFESAAATYLSLIVKVE